MKSYLEFLPGNKFGISPEMRIFVEINLFQYCGVTYFSNSR